MERQEIIEALATYTGRFPKVAVSEAIQAWDDIAPELLEALERTASDVAAAAEVTDQSMLEIFTIFIGAQKRDARVFDPLMRIVLHPVGKDLDRVLGDVLTEDAGRILASVCYGRLCPIEDLIENHDAYEYSRIAGVKALTTLVVEGELGREEAIEYLRELLCGRLEREPSFIWHSVVRLCGILAAQELESEVQQAFEDDIVETFAMRYEDIERDLLADFEDVMSRERGDPHHRFVRNVVEEMRWWAAFRDNTGQQRGGGNSTKGLDWEDVAKMRYPRVATIRNEAPKVGRNEPCPCGSGRKYKHCCGK